MTYFVSFNANSIRLRTHQLSLIKQVLDPEIIAIQETKVTDADFPVQVIKDLGYHAQFFGQKTHYGVAILSKSAPIFVQKGFDEDDDTTQKRFMHAIYKIGDKTIDVLNGYFPQGENCAHPTKFFAKQAFYQNFTQKIAALTAQNKQLIVMGDMNIAPKDLDVGIGESAKARWLKQGTCSFLPIERAWYQAFSAHLYDTYRHIYPEGNLLSWFDYRSKGFNDTPKRGLRIDHILCSQNLLKNLTDGGICYDVRAQEKPSDHAPVWARFDF